MHHEFLDRYAHLDSPIHRLDPRAKILGAGVFIVAMVLSPLDRPFFLLLLPPLILSRVPIPYVLLRSLVVIPFVLFLVIFIPFMEGDRMAGLLRCAEVLVKAMTSVIAVILLASTTRFSRLLQGLDRLRFPKFLILILSFLYRYIFVLVDEVHRMRRSLESRSAGRRPVGGIRVYGSLLGVLFLRAYERAERVYAAMIARGFTGEIRTLGRLSWSRADSFFLLLCWGSVAGLVLWEGFP